MFIGKAIENFMNHSLSSKPEVYTAPQPSTYVVRGHTLTEDDMKALRNVLFAEVSNRPPEKQSLEANTILNTALNRMDQYKAHGTPKSLSEVLTAPNQYQGYGSPEYQRITTGGAKPTDQQKLTAIDTVLSQAKTGALKDNSDGYVYYHHDPAGAIHLTPGALYANTPAPVKTAQPMAPKLTTNPQ